MGKKGTNDTNKLASTFIVITDAIKKIDETVVDMRACKNKVQDMGDASADPQTKEQLGELCNQIQSTCDLTQQKLALIKDQLDKLIARLIEVDKSSQSKMSSVNENVATNKKNMLGGKR